MSKITDVKCQHCSRTVFQRRNNEIYRNGAWEKPNRSFSFQCNFLGCGGWNVFNRQRVNTQTGKETRYAIIDEGLAA